MTDIKSYAEYLLGLIGAQLKDCALQYPALAKEFERDSSRISSAVDQHGVQFILHTMPQWRKHFDSCLSSGRLTSIRQLHFGSWKRRGTVPKLFRGLVLRVFDLEGEMKPDPDVQAIRLVRQLLGVGKRLRVNCSPADTDKAVREFLRTDASVRLGSPFWDNLDEIDPEVLTQLSFTDSCPSLEDQRQGVLPSLSVSPLPYGQAERIQQVADFISASLGQFNPGEVRFRHGPGAVSDRSFGSYRYDFDNWPERLEQVFPMADFAVANYGLWEESSLCRTPRWQLQKEYAAKLMAVPKTLKVPRLIASEPAALQWCQQAIRDFLYSRVNDSILGRFVDFRRQELNGRAALDASRDGEHCTIDLSSASDRISCWFVERLFRRSPDLLRALRSTRSLYIQQDICGKLPRYTYLRKYSTMGNATTFPVQSLAFLAICLGTLLYERGLPLSRKVLRSLGMYEVRVFGDDIIVPKDCAGSTVRALEAFGLVVNDSKTFLDGKFRESCGVDAFAGQDVTSVCVLSAPNKAKPGSVVSLVDSHNNLVRRGYYVTADYIQMLVRSVGYNRIRTVSHGSGCFGWYPNYLSPETRLRTRVNRDRQVRQVYCHYASAKQQRTPPTTSAGLLQFFTEAAEKIEASVSSIGHLTQRAKSSLKLGWVDLE